MNRKIVIGKKLTRWDIVKSFVVITFIPLFILMILQVMIFPAVSMSQGAEVVIIICVFMISWVILIPMIGGTQRMEISNNDVCYYYVKGVLDQYREVLRALMSKDEKCNFKLPVERITSINIAYRTTLGGYGLKGYTITLGFVMKDNTIIKFIPFNISGGGNHNIEYIESFDLLEQSGIKINDKYGLRSMLHLTDYEILEYINSLEDKTYD